jgi:hypothetical protein
MSSSLQGVQKELKQQIFNDYISGMDMEDIKNKYGFKYVRTCYYHIEPISEENKLKRMIAKAARLQEKLKQES